VKTAGGSVDQPKILVVDDDSDFVKLLKIILVRSEFPDVLCCENGADALRLITEERPDLVLLDDMMPDMSGLDVLDQLKAQRIPARVVMLTTKIDPLRYVPLFIRGGACDYVTKPFRPDELIHVVERALALDEDINLRISDLTPIVGKLLVRVEEVWKVSTT
jgi:DNA-binding response OmpR family regulator